MMSQDDYMLTSDYCHAAVLIGAANLPTITERTP